MGQGQLLATMAQVECWAQFQCKAHKLSQQDVGFWNHHNWQDPVASVAVRATTCKTNNEHDLIRMQAYRLAKLAAVLGEKEAVEPALEASKRLRLTHGDTHGLYRRLKMELPFPHV